VELRNIDEDVARARSSGSSRQPFMAFAICLTRSGGWPPLRQQLLQRAYCGCVGRTGSGQLPSAPVPRASRELGPDIDRLRAQTARFGADWPSATSRPSATSAFVTSSSNCSRSGPAHRALGRFQRRRARFEALSVVPLRIETVFVARLSAVNACLHRARWLVVSPRLGRSRLLLVERTHVRD
jgi:hypothetical protein